MESLTKLQKNNIQLRAPEPSDINLLYEWENDPSLWELSNTLVPFSKHTIEQFIQDATLDIYKSKQVRWMIDLMSDEKNRTIGTIDIFDFDPMHKRVGIGVLIKEAENRNKGYASDALTIIIDYCFNVLQLHQIYCNISKENLPSLQLFQKHGFKITGEKKDWLNRNGKWVDELSLQCIRPSST